MLAGVALAGAVVSLALSGTTPFRFVENQTYDLRVALTAPAAQHDFVVVKMDDAADNAMRDASPCRCLAPINKAWLGDLLAALEAVTGAPMSAPVTRGAPGWYHPGRSGVIALGKTVVAQFGELHPRVLAAFDLKVPAAAFEIFLDALPEAKNKGKARPLFAPSPYQAIERDFAFVVTRDIAAGDIVKAVKLAERNLIESAQVFDVYEGKGVPEGHKSVAVAVRIQPKDRTLTDAEIEAVASAIVAGVTKATGATLRS